MIRLFLFALALTAAPAIAQEHQCESQKPVACQATEVFDAAKGICVPAISS